MYLDAPVYIYGASMVIVVWVLITAGRGDVGAAVRVVLLVEKQRRQVCYLATVCRHLSLHPSTRISVLRCTRKRLSLVAKFLGPRSRSCWRLVWYKCTVSP